ncbi:MAG: hypothetical protein OEM19_00450 [Deltaproteobacteria bacterium]|nr:hypothetical protein [Deltaproteobacteria bacterium]
MSGTGVRNTFDAEGFVHVQTGGNASEAWKVLSMSGGTLWIR